MCAVGPVVELLVPDIQIICQRTSRIRLYSNLLEEQCMLAHLRAHAAAAWHSTRPAYPAHPAAPCLVTLLLGHHGLQQDTAAGGHSSSSTVKKMELRRGDHMLRSHQAAIQLGEVGHQMCEMHSCQGKQSQSTQMTLPRWPQQWQLVRCWWWRSKECTAATLLTLRCCAVTLR